MDYVMLGNEPYICLLRKRREQFHDMIVNRCFAGTFIDCHYYDHLKIHGNIHEMTVLIFALQVHLIIVSLYFNN